jgi:DNA-binding NarL/FixJ family response regulator
MSKRILVVEDQEDNRQIIRDLLSATDYELTDAESGEQALEAVAKQRPDLILMDIQLPGIDGYETTPDQGRSGVAVDHDHRGHILCAQWGRAEGAGGWLRRIRAETLQSAPTAGENSSVPALEWQ